MVTKSKIAFDRWPPVAKKLANGADLMLPGVVVDREQGLKAYNLNGRRLQKVCVPSDCLDLTRANVQPFHFPDRGMLFK